MGRDGSPARRIFSLTPGSAYAVPRPNIEARMLRRLTFALLLVAALPAAAPAQIRITRGANATGPELLLEESPAEYGVHEWRVGQWARYSISENVGAPMPLGRARTFSIVGRSGERFWVESSMEFTGGMIQGGGPVRKMAIPFGPLHESVGTEVYTLAPDSSVRRETLVRAGHVERRAPFPRGWTRGAEEQERVAAGAFRAVKYTKGNEELWVSAQAGPIGVVRYRSPDFEVELSARGDSGARSKVPFGGSNR